MGLWLVNPRTPRSVWLAPWLQLLQRSFSSLAAKIALKQNHNKKESFLFYVVYWIQGFSGLLLKLAASATELFSDTEVLSCSSVQSSVSGQALLAGILPGKERKQGNWLEKVKNSLANQILLLLLFDYVLPANIFAFHILKCSFLPCSPEQFWEKRFCFVLFSQDTN